MMYQYTIFQHATYIVKAYRELNLVRTLDEEQEFSPFTFLLFSTEPYSCFWEFISDPRNVCLHLDPVCMLISLLPHNVPHY